MKLRTYQAYTMAEALAAVKRDLGTDAVILNTRTFVRRTALGLRRKRIVEVTATPANEAKPVRLQRTGAAEPSQTTAPRREAVRQMAAKRAYDASASAGSEAVQPVTQEDRKRTRRLAMAMAAQFDQRAATAVVGAPPAARAADPVRIDRSGLGDAIASQEKVEVKPAQRFMLVSPDAPTAKPESHSEEQPKPRASTRATLPASSRAMDDELAAIKTMVGQVLARQTASGGRPTPSLPPKLFDYYLNLIAQDISEELADLIVNNVRDELSRDELDDEAHVRAAIERHLAAYIPAADEPVLLTATDDRPLTIALVGPTGVGKTTTLAKLAASFKLRHGKKVGLITSDTYRIAAVDQLRTYANIIGLPLQVALTPGEMRQATAHLAGCDVILVDTAGRSQNDVLRIDELRALIEACQPHEVHLVLSSTANEKVLLREAEAFSAVGIDKIVLTKLDEAVSFGMLVNVVRQVGKQLSFFTTGQEVPDHIEPGRPQRLAELVLGGALNS